MPEPGPEATRTSISDAVPLLGEWLERRGALGAILVDLGGLASLGALTGPKVFERVRAALAERIRWFAEAHLEEATLASGLDPEEQLVLFVPRDRSDRAFYLRELPRLAERLAESLELHARRALFPYVRTRPSLPVGEYFVLHRPFERVAVQVRALVTGALARARHRLAAQREAEAELLRRIVLEERVRMVYEPIVRIADEAIVGYEALARGPRGSRLETPSELFAAAERARLGFELDALCRRRALAGAPRLGSERKLFLNCLPTSIYDPDLEEARLAALLEARGLHPRQIVLEISEREAIANFDLFREVVDRVAALGVEVALDDTGTGYASLETALELSPHYLKVDLSLVRGIDADPHRRELLRALRAVGQTLKAALIAEGVETREELEALREIGVEYAQGFYFGHAAPAPGGGPDGGR